MRIVISIVFFLSFNTLLYSQQSGDLVLSDTSVVYEYDTVYLTPDTILNKTIIENKLVDKPQSGIILSCSYGISNLKGNDEENFYTLTRYSDSWSYFFDAGIAWYNQLFIIKSGLGLAMLNDIKTESLYSHTDTSIRLSGSSLHVYKMADIYNRMLFLSLPVMPGLRFHYKQLALELCGGTKFYMPLNVKATILSSDTEGMKTIGLADMAFIYPTIEVIGVLQYSFYRYWALNLEVGYSKFLRHHEVFPNALSHGFLTAKVGISKTILFENE